MSDTIDLISETLEYGSDGVPNPVETSRTVFCEVSSVGMHEWFEGGRNGLNPQFQFRVFSGDYNDEEICVFRGKRYRIYRTYINGDQTELYAEKRKGVSND